MTPTPPRIPPASLHEEWSVASVQRLAQAMGRPVTTPEKGRSAAERTGGTRLDLDPVRRARRLAALRRLATDAAATPAERTLAAQRLARLDPAVRPFAC